MWRCLCVLTMFACADTSSILCDNGTTCGFDALCDTVHGGCIVQDQLDACRGLGNGTTCSTEVTGPGVCDEGVCLGQRCGDGYRATEEVCDGTEFSAIVDCTSYGFYNPEGLLCSATCEPDPSGCTGRCGDSVINGPELCDGAPPAGQDCITYGFGTGVLDCGAGCAAEFSQCIPFGWQAIPMPKNVRAIAGTSDTNIWVTGEGGMVRRFDGSSWTAIDVSACALGDITSVVPLSATDAVLLDDPVGTDGVIRVSTTGCSRTTLPVTDRIHAIWATSLTNIYAAEDDGNTALWHFDGTGWSAENAVRARFIWGSGPDDIYTGSIFRADVQHFSNGTWSSITVPDAASVWGIWGTSANDVFVAATDANDRALLKRFHDGTWTTELARLPILGTGSTIGGGSSFGDRTAVVGMTSAQPYVFEATGDGWANLGVELSDGGSTFTTPSGALYVAAKGQPRVLRFSGTTNLRPAPLLSSVKVHAVDAGTAIATVRIGLNPMHSTAFWDGAQWTPEPSINNSVSSVAVLPTGEVYVVSTSTALRQRTGFDAYTPLVDIRGIRVAGTSPSDVWVITAALPGQITHWNGTAGDTYDNVIPNADHLLALTPSLAFVISDTGAMARWTGSWNAFTSPLTARALGVSRTSDTEAWAWHATQIVHYVNGAWTTVALPPGETSVNGVWGTTDDLFVAGTTGLHYFDGVQWMRVDTGEAFEIRSLDGRAGSIYFSTFNTVRQLYRTAPW